MEHVGRLEDIVDVADVSNSRRRKGELSWKHMVAVAVRDRYLKQPPKDSLSAPMVGSLSEPVVGEFVLMVVDDNQ